MKQGPILEELWRVKDELAREADYDIDRIFAELRRAEARHPGQVLHSAEDLRRYAAEQERSLAEASALKEQPPVRRS